MRWATARGVWQKQNAHLLPSPLGRTQCPSTKTRCSHSPQPPSGRPKDRGLRPPPAIQPPADRRLNYRWEKGLGPQDASHEPDPITLKNNLNHNTNIQIGSEYKTSKSPPQPIQMLSFNINSCTSNSVEYKSNGVHWCSLAAVHRKIQVFVITEKPQDCQCTSRQPRCNTHAFTTHQP